MEKRWLEVQFYYLCQTILGETKELQSVINFVEGMSFLSNYKIEQIKQLAVQSLTDPALQPSRKEYALLAHQNNIPVRKILKRLRLHISTFYTWIEENKKDPTKFYPRLSQESHDIIESLFKTIDFIKEL